MEKFNIINIPFYKFYAEKELISKIFEDVQKIKYVPESEPNLGSVSDNYFHQELFKWFNTCIKQVANEYYQNSIDFPIVDCWVNKYTSLTRLKKHNHANSIICGLYYVTTHNSGNTVFEHPNPWSFSANGPSFNLSIDKGNEIIEGEINPVAGTLILFPGNLMHYMKTFKDTKSDKYSIAFNTFPSGEISNHKSMRLHITTKIQKG